MADSGLVFNRSWVSEVDETHQKHQPSRGRAVTGTCLGGLPWVRGR